MTAAIRAAAVTALIFLLGGCALGWRAGGGLVVDTQGGVGVQATVGGTWGLALNDNQGMVLTADVGLGLKYADLPLSLFAGAGCGYVYADKLGIRLSLLAAGGGELGHGARAMMHVGGAIAVIDQPKEGGLGGELQGLFVKRGAGETDSEGFGQFVLSLIYEQIMLSPFKYRHPH